MKKEVFTHIKVRLLIWYNPDPPMIPISTIRFRSGYYIEFLFDDYKDILHLARWTLWLC